MKLIYLTGFGLPTVWAHGIQVMKMCEAFSEAGNEVELVVPRRRNEKKEDPFDYYNVNRNFKIVKLFCLDLCPGNPRGFYFWLRLISFLFISMFYLLFKKIDVLYTREQLAGLFFNKFFLELHFLPWSAKKWQIRVWQKAERLIVLNNLMKRELANFCVDENKILVAPDGVDLEKFDLKITKEEARKKTGLPQDKKIIMYSGSLYLYDWKGIDVFLEAAKILPEDYLVVLVGGAPDEVAKIKKEYSGNNLLLVGRRRHEEIPSYLKSADVLVLPNKKGDKISEKYTSPLKLFEYMASGVPIVASSLPSIREILNEHNAVMVESNNPETLARGIKKIIEDRILAEKIARQAFFEVQNFTWQKRDKNIIDFINH